MIGIVGYGYVGKAMYKFFSAKYKTVFYDPYVEGSCTKNDINNCDLAVICVFTAECPNGQCDTSIVEETVAWVNTPLIMIKSTIPPGTTDRLSKLYHDKHICFSPEYIGEGDYCHGPTSFNKDVAMCPFFTIGGKQDDVDKIFDLIIPIAGPNKKYHATTATAAELAKYMENCFLATKVIFSYEFDQICKSFGVPYSLVREAWLLDPRMDSNHTGVFATNVAPYSGKCLPKDIKAIIYAAQASGYVPYFLKELDTSNQRLATIRKKKMA
jgi:UDPglucose 6-dehydrogenase